MVSFYSAYEKNYQLESRATFAMDMVSFGISICQFELGLEETKKFIKTKGTKEEIDESYKTIAIELNKKYYPNFKPLFSRDATDGYDFGRFVFLLMTVDLNEVPHYNQRYNIEAALGQLADFYEIEIENEKKKRKKILF